MYPEPRHYLRRLGPNTAIFMRTGQRHPYRTRRRTCGGCGHANASEPRAPVHQRRLGPFPSRPGPHSRRSLEPLPYRSLPRRPSASGVHTYPDARGHEFGDDRQHTSHLLFHCHAMSARPRRLTTYVDVVRAGLRQGKPASDGVFRRGIPAPIGERVRCDIQDPHHDTTSRPVKVLGRQDERCARSDAWCAHFGDSSSDRRQLSTPDAADSGSGPSRCILQSFADGRKYDLPRRASRLDQ